MIKFTGEIAGRPALGLGIDARNVQLLKQGRPLRVDGQKIGVSHDVYIFYGDSLKDILRELRKAGVDFPTPKIDHGDGEMPDV